MSTPGRPQLPYPLPSGEPPGTPGAGMQHPSYNPAGYYPGPAVTRTLETYGEERGQRWVFNATDSLWQWMFSTPVFDLRPGITPALGNAGATAGRPVNHEGALGLNHYLNVLVTSPSGTTPPASWPFITCDYWEDGHSTSADRVDRLTFDTVAITDTLLAGGNIAGATLSGGSNLNFYPPPGLRFWRVHVRLNVPGVAGSPPATDFKIWAAAH